MLDQVEEALLGVDKALNQAIDTDVDLLHEASKHIISSGGKRVRPRIVLLAYLAAGGRDVDEIVPLAAAVELVHTATLVHDDINDHSLTRRGKIAVHARWGRTFALLTGDYLFTKVYELMAPYGPDFNVLMADACVKLVEGETLQAAAAKAGSIDQKTYQEIIIRKTASLFEAAARMGAGYAGGNGLVVEALSQYARYLGLAFQIVDDVLDIIGDPQTLGKPVGSDLIQGAGAILAQNGRENRDVTVLTIEEENDPIKRMMSRLRESGAVNVAMAQALELAGRARAELMKVPVSPARNELEGLIDLVVDRQN